MSLSRAEIEVDIEGLEGANCPEKCSFQTIWGEGAIGSGACPATDTVQVAPTLRYEGTEGAKYTIICSDPDAISRSQPIYREFIHWVRSDITFDASGACTSAGTQQEVLSYCGPAPPHSSGMHRYVFLLYEQPAAATPADLAASFEGRGGKHAHVSATACGLGQLRGWDWIECEWAPCVDAVHDSLSFLPPPEYQSPKQKAAAAAAAA